MATPIQCLILLSSGFNHLVFSVFKKIILEVLDIQSNCEEHTCILNNQFPLLTLYITGTFIQLSEQTLKQYY